MNIESPEARDSCGRSCDTGITRVVIVDDHTAIIQMMEQVIELFPGFSVMGTATDGKSALEVCAGRPVDVIVLDLVLPDVKGVTLLAELTRVCPQARILLFTGNLNAAMLKDCLTAGAHGVVEKMEPLETLHAGLRAVSSGLTFLGSHASELMKELVLHPERAAGAGGNLTPRERDVLALLAQGLSSKEIASKLSLSLHTVVNHRSRLMQKTGRKRVAQLSRYAMELGLVKLDTMSRLN